MVPNELTDSNDLNKYIQGQPQAVDLPNDVLAGEALAYLDALEWSATDNAVRKSTGARGSKYIGAMMAGGGVALGDLVPIARGFCHKMTVAAGTTTLAQGDKVKATTSTTCELVSPVAGSYIYQSNIYGQSMEAGAAGAEVWIFVEPEINQ